jgi:KipI family sensor histidine kinase inhibitor
MGYRLIRYGDRGLLVEFDRPSEVSAHWPALAAGRPSGVIDVVPAARTVLVGFEPALIGAEPVERWVVQRLAVPVGERAPRGSVAGDVVELAVRYDGADLADVAERIGCSVAEVVQRHSGPEYTVQFCGFAPGFGYLRGLDPSLVLPRLAAPRPVVPAGSVAIADEYSGVYPRPSPGGWRLLGHTDAVLFDPARTPPAVLTPGTPVRFIPA